jgi:gliding motility-associated-like protein
MRKISLIILFLLSFAAQSQDITRFEYFFDTDPGFGAGTITNVTPATTITDFDIPVATSSLSTGFHKLYIRAQNATNQWTHTHIRSFYIIPFIASTNITQVEYFIDTDPGIGLATQVSFTAASTITNLAIDISAVPLIQGFHKLYVRTKSSDGQWTHTHTRSFYVANVGVAQNLVKFEYFFDTDPGFDNGTSATISPAAPSVTNQDVFADATGLAIGSHTIYVRAKDSGGEWTQVSTGAFSVTAALPPTITSFTPSSGPVGTTIIITGTNFSTTPANNIVYFGATKATVTSATSTQLTTTVPAGATYQPITVSVSGLTAQSHLPFIVTFAGGGSFEDCSFAPSISLGMTAGFTRSAFADIDGDGKPDLLIPYSNDDLFAILRNISTIGLIASTSFEPKIDFITGDTPFGIATGDLDGDSKPDIAVINYRGGQLSIYKNLSTPGNILLAPKVDFTIPDFGHDVWIADVDGDGKQDLAITTSLAGMTVLRNTTTTGVINASSFAPGITFATGPNPNPFALGDMDGDGKLDAAIPNANAFSVSLLRNTSTPGTISFASQVLLPITTGSPVPGGGSVFTAFGDIDDDGKLDLVVTTNTINTISLFRNTSTSGSFSFDPQVALPVVEPLNKPVLSDLDGDGKIELVVDFSSNGNLVFKNQATPGSINASTFSTPITFPKLPSRSILLGDVDGDGRNDIISTSSNVQVLRNLVGTVSAPTITSFSQTSGVVGSSVTITGTNFGTLFSKTVEFNGTSATITGSTASTLTVTVPAGATTGPVKVKIGCNTITGSNFTVGSPATITITTQPSDFIACVGQTATFTTAASGTTNIIYQWQFSPDGIVPYTDIANAGGYSNATTATLSVNTSANFGLGRYRCRINGDFAPEVITNDQGLSFNAISAAPTVVGANRCGTGTVTLSATGGSNGQYRWYTTATGGTAIPGEVNGSYVTPVVTTTTTYFVAIYNGSCESLRTPVTATINTPPAIAIITSNIPAVGNALTICSTTSLTLSAPAGFASYSWSTGATTQQISVNASGNYSVTVTDANGCISPASVALAVTVTPAPCNNLAPVIIGTTSSTVIGGQATINLLDLISDADNNLVLSSLAITQQPTSGAPATIVNGVLVIDYKDVNFSGRDQLTIEVCDVFGECVQQVLEIDVIGDIEIYNGISSNNDNQNEIFLIRNIDLLPDTRNNRVTIYNRWGSKVFEVSDYNNTTNVFKGLSENGSELPSGIYFYKIEFENGRIEETGYLSLKR